MKKPSIVTAFITALLVLLLSGCMEQTSTIQNTNDDMEVIENIPPHVSIQAGPNEGMVPLIVSFTGVGEDTDGAIINYIWDFDDGTTSYEQNISHTFTMDGSYEVVLAVTDDQGATAIARFIITVNPLPADWTLTLKGAQTKVINCLQFESYIELYEEASWEDDGNVWTGLPLWYLVAMVDDNEPEGEYTFDDDLASRRYTIEITAGDGWETMLKSNDIAHDNGYIIVNKVNGEPLPKDTPKGKPSWPLHLRGSKVFCPDNVGNITEIELVGLPEDDAQNNQPIRSFLRNIFQNLFPRWYDFFSDIKDYFINS